MKDDGSISLPCRLNEILCSNVASVAAELLGRTNSGGVFSLESASIDSALSRGSKSVTTSPVLGHGPFKSQLNIQEFFKPLSHVSSASKTLLVRAKAKNKDRSSSRSKETSASLPKENVAVQPEGRRSPVPTAHKKMRREDASVAHKKEVEALQKRLKEVEELRNRELNLLQLKSCEIEELKKELGTVRSKYKKLQSRVFVEMEKVLRDIDVEKNRMLRKRACEDSHTLGRIVVTKHGVGPNAKLGESWKDGVAIASIKERQGKLLALKEELDKQKKSLAKLNRQRAKAPEGSKSGDELEVEQLEAMGAEEALKLQLSQLRKREVALAEEARRVSVEKLAFIRDVKRLNHEEASRFINRPVLNNRYLLRCLLGKGGFSEVWRAYDLVSLRDVAVKVHELNSNWSEHKKALYLKHATREYKIHLCLKHPRIVQLWDVFEIDSSSFATVLEHCDGTDLELYLKKNKYLCEKEARAILLQILAGLRYLSSGGDLPVVDAHGNALDKQPSRSSPKRPCIIHYDLKPGNILFDKHGGIKITDFGLSKIMEPADTETTGIELTSQGAGTYWYLPPECFQCDQAPKISSKVDVWSIGVIFYQMLYGKRPFGEGMTQDKILMDRTIVNAKEVEFPDKPNVTSEAKLFIKRCLTYMQEFRPDVKTICQDPYLRQKKV